MDNEPRLEEQVIDAVAEVGISSQVDNAEKIDVDIQTNLLKLILGQADSVDFTGQGVVIQKDIRLQEIEVQTDKVDVNPLSALFGKVELDKPLDAIAKIVITEPDLNRALKSEYVLKKARNFKINVDGQTVILEMQQMQLQLPGDNKMVFDGKVLLHEKGETQPLGFTATFRPRTQKQPVIVENFQCDRNEGISFAIALSLMEKVKQWMELPYFDLEGIALRVEEMTAQAGQLALQIQMRMKQIPQNLI
ncbi:MAG: hypothetical protein N4J56_000388 [Chroococcidiopsis sp. SAG 2025]|uniref:LmeA family phospholipid-binding protein n=1 Tax=Chroococcidiopsis sp. SAG 2025 TaxID=171389 RepID=UPI00293744E3|nr:DUF2993 domain-containing protein [Chroococcidiopsis sp. SAG 2025]MDV2990734.1 hypothetical protein [Chroococcidiopsis sp. SAG 2025]